MSLLRLSRILSLSNRRTIFNDSFHYRHVSCLTRQRINQFNSPYHTVFLASQHTYYPNAYNRWSLFHIKTSTYDAFGRGDREREENSTPTEGNMLHFIMYLVAKGFCLLCGVLFAIYFYDCYLLEFPLIDTNTLFSYVDRGEVETCFVTFDKVFVKYYQDTDRSFNLVLLHEGPVDFIRSLWDRQKQFNVPQARRLSVKFGMPPGYSRLPDYMENHILLLLLMFLNTVVIDLVLLYRGKFPLPPSTHAKWQKQPPKQEAPSVKPEWFKAFRVEQNTINNTPTGVRFQDIGGMRACKAEVLRFVDCLKDLKSFNKLGQTVPRVVLLRGPDGNGKTMLAKALAAEANVPLFCISGSELSRMVGGLGVTRLRKLFRQASERAPSIVFIDQLEMLGLRRSTMVSNPELDRTLNQLLVELDGVGTFSQVLVFGATDQVNLVDPSLLKVGRFDHHIRVDLPDGTDREEILHLYMKNVTLDPTVSKSNLIKHLAEETAGKSGADIASLCNEAADLASRRGCDGSFAVTSADFEAALMMISGDNATQQGDSRRGGISNS